MSELLLQATKFKVVRRVFDIPGHGQADREIVVHPGAVVILPLLVDDRVVMIRNQRFAVGQELLELPAGTYEPGESNEDCARRELEEETGYRAGRVEQLCQFYSSPGFTDELLVVFVATDLTLTAQNLDATEQISVELMSYEDALDACLDGQIIDGKTIATLLLYDRRRRTNR
jgi:ADP-ribose pyrophosphatase